jgi:hypothetical protein
MRIELCVLARQYGNARKLLRRRPEFSHVTLHR